MHYGRLSGTEYATPERSLDITALALQSIYASSSGRSTKGNATSWSSEKVAPQIWLPLRTYPNPLPWLNRLTTNGEQTVRPELVEGRGLSDPLSCWIGSKSP
jgi:hypothetical protein